VHHRDRVSPAEILGWSALGAGTGLALRIAAGALASVRHLKANNALRERNQERAARLKHLFHVAGFPVMASESHIVPVLVGDARLCKAASDRLLEEHAVYVQPINYPTVPRGQERLRFTPTPFHSDSDMDRLVAALYRVWRDLGLTLKKAA
jgi:5-aminolevulinate synthase